MITGVKSVDNWVS